MRNKLAKAVQQGGEIELDVGELNPKQWEFMESKCRYTAYGGARGGGKTHVLIRRAITGALQYGQIKILIIRRTYPELEPTIIRPMLELINTATANGRPAGEQLASYNGTMRLIRFMNGSTIKFGHLQSMNSITEYQGQEYDWIFMDEATQFTENEFRTLGATLRGVNKIPKRFYLTCNPGGIGHQWVKRLFVERHYHQKSGERGEDYRFIPATVEDNTALMKSSPEYLQMLDALPDDIRRAHRYGDWDALAGQYFSEFKREVYVVPSFIVPKEWPRYRSFDYGLDMFACYWYAIDFDGRIWVYREYCQDGLIVSEAASAMRALTPPDEFIQYTVAPPDMWSTQKDTGRTMAEIFTQNGIGLVRASNSRVQGWMQVKEYMKIRPDGKPGILITKDCATLIEHLQAVQHDEKNPSDVAKEPHEFTHSPDALRYFCIFRSLGAQRVLEQDMEEDDVGLEDYDEAMTGGQADESYLSY